MKSNNYTAVAIFAVITLLFLGQDIANGNYSSVLEEDTLTYSSWTWQFSDLLKAGDVYPRWMPLDNCEYGSPAFLTYPPLAFYAASALHFSGFSIIQSMSGIKAIGFFLSSWGTYLLLRRKLPFKVSLLSSLFYSLLPVNIFSYTYYGTFATLFAMAWPPFIVLFLDKAFDEKNAKSILISGTLIAFLTLSHLIVAYMFGFLLLFKTISKSFNEKSIKCALIFTLTILWSALISSAYLLPALAERKHIQNDNFIHRTVGFDFKQFFIDVPPTGRAVESQFWITYQGFLEANIHFFIALLLIVCFLLFYVKAKDGRKYFIGNETTSLLLFTALCILLNFKLSSPLWDHLPYLKYVQFPFRWISLISFGIGLLFVPTLYNSFKNKKHQKAITFFIFVTISFFLLLDFEMLRNRHTFAESELIPPIGINWTPEHLPKSVPPKRIMNISQREPFFIEGIGKAIKISKHQNKIEYYFETQTAATVRLAIFYFPGWIARIGNDMLPLIEERESGMILIKVPPGRHQISLRFRDTAVRTIGKIITILCSLVFLLYVPLNSFTNRAKQF